MSRFETVGSLSYRSVATLAAAPRHSAVYKFIILSTVHHCSTQHASVVKNDHPFSTEMHHSSTKIHPFSMEKSSFPTWHCGSARTYASPPATPPDLAANVAAIRCKPNKKRLSDSAKRVQTRRNQEENAPFLSRVRRQHKEGCCKPE